MVVKVDLLMGLLPVGTSPVPNTLVGFYEPAPNTSLPCPALIQGEGDRRKVEGGEMRGLGRGSGHQDAVNEKHH